MRRRPLRKKLGNLTQDGRNARERREKSNKKTEHRRFDKINPHL